jgi:hypothetical protein
MGLLLSASLLLLVSSSAMALVAAVARSNAAIDDMARALMR